MSALHPVSCRENLSRTLGGYQGQRQLRLPGYRAKERPSGHKITHKFTEQGGAIPPNLLTLGNNDANGYYLSRCAEEKIKPHPARFPVQLPEFFIKFPTSEGDMVLDPFAGSCTTGEAAERLSRKWIGFEPVPPPAPAPGRML